ncbi:MAG: hypothetical protein HY040_15250 [Planctomycetes bacterium]|nr:hypothetical protein [Planctomycetota bacterium]
MNYALCLRFRAIPDLLAHGQISPALHRSFFYPFPWSSFWGPLHLSVRKQPCAFHFSDHRAQNVFVHRRLRDDLRLPTASVHQQYGPLFLRAGADDLPQLVTELRIALSDRGFGQQFEELPHLM